MVGRQTGLGVGARVNTERPVFGRICPHGLPRLTGCRTDSPLGKARGLPDAGFDRGGCRRVRDGGGGWNPQIAGEDSGAVVKGEGVDEGGEDLEDVAGGDEDAELGPEAAVGVDGEGAGVEVGDEDDGDGVDELGDERGAVVAEPEVLAAGEAFPEVEDLDVDELGDHVGDHRRGDGTEGEGADLEEDGQSAGGVGGDLARRGVEGLEAGQGAAEPEDADDPEIQEEADDDDAVGAGPAEELGDEVGAEEGDGVGQDADGDGEDDGGGFGVAVEIDLEELDEAGDAQDVEHRERAEEEAREDKEDPLAAFVENGLGEVGAAWVGVLLAGQRLVCVLGSGGLRHLVGC